MALCATDISATTTLSPSIVSSQVPKSGTVIPNRIFVGGIATQTTDSQLKDFFSAFGAVKDTKIICDRAGVSKGYGFVTFETQEDAEKIINKESENLIFKDRKLNIGPAVRKQQAFPRLIDGYPAVSGTPAMFLTQNPYGYATAGGLAMMPTESYQQALQQQVQTQVGTANYPNMIIPTQLPVYMPPTAYPYSTTPVQTQVASPMQYPNAATPQWISTGCYQPSPVTAVSTPSMIYPESMIYNGTPTTDPTQQFLERSEGTLHENGTNNVESRCSSVVTSTDGLHSQLSNCQAMTNLMSVQPGRTLHQPQHSYQGNTSVSPQPPPVKKMTTMPPHYHAGCFNAPLVGANLKSRAPASMTYIPHAHEMRVKFDHDGRIAASMAPPTPPATPASIGGN